MRNGNPWGLTPREVEALKTASEHFRRADAARALGIPVTCLHAFLSSVYGKMREVEPDDGHRIGLWIAAERYRKFERAGV